MFKLDQWGNLIPTNLYCQIEGDGDDGNSAAPTDGNVADDSTTVDAGDSDAGNGSSEPVVSSAPSQPAPVRDPKNPTKEWIEEIRAKGGQAKLDADEVKALLNFKPKAAKNTDQPKVEPKAAPKAKAPVDPKAQPKAKTPAAAPKAKAAPAPAAAPVEPMAKVVQTLEKVADRLDGKNQPPTQEPDPQSLDWYGDVAGKKAHTPALTVPPQLMEMIDNDDPQVRQQGLNQVVNGVGNVIMRDVMQKLLPNVMQAIMSQVPQVITQHQAQRESSQAFYGKYPQLAQPALKPVLDNLGQQVALAWQAEGKNPIRQDGTMDPEFMDNVAAAFFAMTGAAAPAPAISQNTPGQTTQVVQQQTQTAPAPGRRQPFFTGVSARPPAATQSQTKSAEILSTIKAH